MMNLEQLLLRGAASGNLEEGLQELRYTVLTKGIPANSEGMVSSTSHSFSNLQCNGLFSNPSLHSMELTEHNSSPSSAYIYG